MGAVKTIIVYGVFGICFLVIITGIFNHTQWEGIKFFDNKIGWWSSNPLLMQNLSKVKRTDVDQWRSQTWNFTYKERGCCGDPKGITITFQSIPFRSTEYFFWFYPSGQIKWVGRSTYGEIMKMATFNEDGSLKDVVPKNYKQ